jgi:hypothetical protein
MIIALKVVFGTITDSSRISLNNNEMAESKINTQVVELSTAVLDLQQIVRKLFDQIHAIFFS